MIIEAFINGAFSLVEWIIQLFPAFPALEAVSSASSGVFALISVAGQFVPLDMFVFCIGNIAMWLAIQMAISALRFFLDFVPLMG